MSDPNPSSRGIPALFTSLGNLVGRHFREIALITGTLGGIAAILNSFFGIRLVPYGDAFVEIITSDGSVIVLLLLVLISQVLLYQRVDWIVSQLEEDDGGKDHEDASETNKVLTDGGASDLPPRDSQGRFTTKDRGGTNIFLLLLAAITGYIIGGETGLMDPVAGAFIAIAVVSVFQMIEG